MFNHRNHKSAQITNQEVRLRDHKVDPKADDGQPITEKVLPHRTGDTEVTTEGQFAKADRTGGDDQIIEKILNEAEGYIPHRSDATWLSVPPVAALTEKLRQNRLKSDWKPMQEDHWSLKMSEDQNGELPKWKKNAPQHDKSVLGNDPQRFEKIDNLPTRDMANDNIAAYDNTKTITPLVGNITVADIDRVANSIKTGQTIDYDAAIVGVLKQARSENRELTSVEEKIISDLKVSRTNSLLAST